MASKKSDLLSQLKEHGWNLLRHGTKHSIYVKGDKTVVIPRGTKLFSRSYKIILGKIEGKLSIKDRRFVNSLDQETSASVPEHQYD
jgi:predicted RNA binding protein YcfA (HicA-like mRNA interferase family)